MLEQGFDLYLLDWGEFGDEDQELTLADCVEDTLPRRSSESWVPSYHR